MFYLWLLVCVYYYR